MRRFTIWFVLTAVLLSAACFAAPGYEAVWKPGKGGELLKAYGFISGGADGDLMLDSRLTREQLAIILCELYGLRAEAARYGGLPDYSDVNRISAWSRSYVAFCREKGWMIGIGKAFSPKGYVGSEQLSAAVLRVLGYEAVWGTGAETLRGLGVELPDSPALSRREVFDALWKVVSLPIMKTGEVLGEVTGRLQDTPLPFAVTRIQSDNYGYIYVEFNKAIDPATVSPSSISLAGVEFGSVRTTRNGVYFIPTLLLKEGSAQVEIRGIRPLWGKDGEIYHREWITISDASGPEFLGIEFAGERAITLIFSEPISKAGNIQLKQKNAIIGVSSDGLTGLGTNRLTYSVQTTFIEGRTYGIDAAYFKDLVGNNSTKAYREEVYYPERTSPSVQVGEQTGAYVELIFDRRVSGLDNAHFYIGSSSNKPIRITTTTNFNDKAVERTDRVERVYLWFYSESEPDSKGVPAAASSLYIDGRMIMDDFKNRLPSDSYTVKAPRSSSSKIE